MLHKSYLMPQCIVRWLVRWCTWLPNICFVVNTLLQFLTDLRHVHLIVAKHVLRYLKSTVEYGLKYATDQRINLNGYVDSDWGGSTRDRKSTSRCCFSLGSGMISWFSRKQSRVALSTTKAKYIASCLASCEVVWLQKLLSDLFDLELEATCTFCDNQSFVKFSKNPVFHDKSKHI